MVLSVICSSQDVIVAVTLLTTVAFRIVNNETLTLSAAQSAVLCGQLQNCDLRGSGVKACGACLVR